ncbi:hypothetical protein D7B24_005936 [Verticillium nonalfalfae]|uniref:Uncharacterized protein n=1 Tax=Verticillium nonalfalfae TaxID=1051616 RepID=A0A3M9YLZ8_9PEZI|nr:uncharacterized protein D7B24_005936 [Verticillium nonalfalfae]RNJ60786.1 hypothetical protein D7B24_005936 [Verticillium nonalfalfae]
MLSGAAAPPKKILVTSFNQPNYGYDAFRCPTLLSWPFFGLARVHWKTPVTPALVPN